MKRDPRSIWNKARKASTLSRQDARAIGAMITIVVDSVYQEMNRGVMSGVSIQQLLQLELLGLWQVSNLC